MRGRLILSSWKTRNSAHNPFGAVKISLASYSCWRADLLLPDKRSVLFWPGQQTWVSPEQCVEVVQSALLLQICLIDGVAFSSH
jgi:hypothetical protein